MASPQEHEKKLAAEAAVDYVLDGMIVGLGSGSTAYFAVKKLGERVRNGLWIQAIPTSEQTAQWAVAEQISLIDFSQTTTIDLTIDGADEIDSNLNMIKGGGGALLREKVVASASKEVIIIVDSSKVVQPLGKFPLPVEVVPYAWQVVQRRLKALGVQPLLRQKNEQIFVTDNHNYILDCPLGRIEHPVELEQQLNQIPGIVVNGLFINLATRLLIGKGQQVDVKERKRS